MWSDQCTKRQIKRLNNSLDTSIAPDSKIDGEVIDTNNLYSFTQGIEGLKSDVYLINRPQALKVTVKIKNFLADIEKMMLAIV